jgi:hypothetical protein
MAGNHRISIAKLVLSFAEVLLDSPLANECSSSHGCEGVMGSIS